MLLHEYLVSSTEIFIILHERVLTGPWVNQSPANIDDPSRKSKVGPRAEREANPPTTTDGATFHCNQVLATATLAMLSPTLTKV